MVLTRLLTWKFPSNHLSQRVIRHISISRNFQSIKCFQYFGVLLNPACAKPQLNHGENRIQWSSTKGFDPSSKSSSNEGIGHIEVGGHPMRTLVETEPMEGKTKEELIVAKAHFVAQHIDPLRLYQNIYAGKFADLQTDSIIVTSKVRSHSLENPYAKYSEIHTAIFKYGSVVFFNQNEDQIKKQLRDIERHSIAPINVSFQHVDDHTIKVRPWLNQVCVMRRNETLVREINYKNLAVISRVMGQTVALNYYEKMVDNMLEDFNKLNNVVAKTGAFTAMEIKKLFQLVARNNSILTNVIAEVGLLERSETAWRHAEYDQLWEGLREDFDLDNRFKNLELKLNLIQSNTKFFLEILHNQKSDKLEWIIIILIAAEIMIAICDMVGYKPPFVMKNEES